MKQIRAESLLGLTFKVMLASVLGISACTPNPSQPQPTDNTDTSASVEGLRTPEKPLPATQKNFEDFLKYFRSNVTYKHWPDSVQLRFMDDIDFYTPGKEEALVKRVLKRIPVQYEAFLPIEAIKNYDDYLPTNLPQESYHFYAYQRIDYGDFWLLSIFAFKEPYKEGEYHQHHFFASTYSKEGKVIDEFNWWTFIYDDVQIPTQTSAVWGDTMVGGYVSDPEEGTFDEIYIKTMLRPSGKFDTVFYHPHVPSMY